jgi:hypothetical protein
MPSTQASTRIRLPVSRNAWCAFSNACFDYLNYDRLGKKEVHKHLADGDRDLHRWLAEYGIESMSRDPDRISVNRPVGPLQPAQLSNEGLARL